MEGLQPAISLSILGLATLFSVLIRYRTVRKQRESRIAPDGVSRQPPCVRESEKLGRVRPSNTVVKPVSVTSRGQGDDVTSGKGVGNGHALSQKPGCAMNGGLVKEKARYTSVTSSIVCGTCGSPRQLRKGGCVCTLKIYHRLPPSTHPQHGYSNFRLQPWDTAPSSVRRRGVKAKVARVKPEVRRVTISGGNGYRQSGMATPGVKTPIANGVVEDVKTGSPHGGLEKDGDGHDVIANGKSGSSTINGSSVVENPSRLSLISNMTVQSAPPSCYRTPEVTRLENNVASLTDMRKHKLSNGGNFDCDPEDGLFLDSMSEDKRSVSSLVLGMNMYIK